ncbi:ATP-dependent helicase [Burkholderiaceae bacterium FT117]|uniref:ATP-dependent helicase n=1 Tax=Zeimonas sediminis TaxID=2944268 RepID=UPI0023432464|nr:ATP-dependent helicase [Zeimonas sediminis]MCM5571426.1 ATP-dependent helicase [Zeimonas sediminis]
MSVDVIAPAAAGVFPDSPADSLTEAQRRAACWGAVGPDGRFRSPPLLVVAGAGTGKTATIAHRVAHLVLAGVDPQRILLLTFSRRAATEMTRRAGRLVARALSARAGRPLPAAAAAVRLPWAGTFHSVGARLLREHAPAIGLDPSFGILDRGDAADLIDAIRHELGFSATKKRFPRKEACLAIHSLQANTAWPLDRVLQGWPWCADWRAELEALFAHYAARKRANAVLDYDDLLLEWERAMGVHEVSARLRARFDQVLVDEFQDTNALQARILRALKPDGQGLTVVGDDAQSIYAFRGADVGNILDFPASFEPPAERVTLEENFRSVQPVLDLANALLSEAARKFPKTLSAARGGGARPQLVTVADERAQADWVIDAVLRHREEGVPLKRQAVLFRSAHHSDLLEVELVRRNVPYVKHGGLRFLDAAHVKDLLAVLRWAEHPRNLLAGFRVLQLLPGFGPANAQRCLERVKEAGIADALRGFEPPAAAREAWSGFVELMAALADSAARWPSEQFDPLLAWYRPLLERRHDDATVRANDLEQLAVIATRFGSRERFLTELALDPPQAAGDLAGEPLRDEDWLNLSTVHSAKGQEWDAVCVLNVTDGNFPNEYATGDAAAIEEERRLLYVAVTRARDALYLLEPKAFYVTGQQRWGDRHVWGARSRFLTEPVLAQLDWVAPAAGNALP